MTRSRGWECPWTESRKHRLPKRKLMSTRFNLHRVAWRILTKVHVRRAGLQLGDAVELALVLPLENHDDDWRL